MKELTSFQKKCEADLNNALEDAGHRLEERTLDGINETYIRARISGTDNTIFIYEDEAGIQGPDKDLRFEVPDYTSQDKLIEDFVFKSVSLL